MPPFFYIDRPREEEGPLSMRNTAQGGGGAMSQSAAPREEVGDRRRLRQPREEEWGHRGHGSQGGGGEPAAFHDPDLRDPYLSGDAPGRRRERRQSAMAREEEGHRSFYLLRRPQGGGGGRRGSDRPREEEGPSVLCSRLSPYIGCDDVREEEDIVAFAEGPGRRRGRQKLICRMLLHEQRSGSTCGSGPDRSAHARSASSARSSSG